MGRGRNCAVVKPGDVVLFDLFSVNARVRYGLGLIVASDAALMPFVIVLWSGPDPQRRMGRYEAKMLKKVNI